MNTLPASSSYAQHWILDPDIVFLNHGSYGATPRAALDAQQRYRNQMEREPVRFFMLDIEAMLDHARQAVAEFVNCDMEGIAFLHNVTQAVATVIDNLDIEPGDEILVNDHEYSACISCLTKAATRRGAKMIKVSIPFPTPSSEAIFDAVIGALTARTKLVLLSHITSPTALVFPVAKLVAACRDRGIETLVDGAHAPGQIEVNVNAINAHYYTANLHKWPCCPKGTAFLWVHPERRQGFEPLALSARAHLRRDDRDRYRCLFDYIGTDDYTGFLAIPDALDCMSGLAGSWQAVREHNRALALQGRNILCDALGSEPATPDELVGTMATLIVPGTGLSSGGTRPGGYEDPLQQVLVEKYHIQVPVWSLPSQGHRLLRISAQLYNSLDQYAYLATSLIAALEQES